MALGHELDVGPITPLQQEENEMKSRSNHCVTCIVSWIFESAQSLNMAKQNRSKRDSRAEECETPLVAFKDVSPLLRALARELHGGSASSLRVWDPFVGSGRSIQLLTHLGFASAFHTPKCALLYGIDAPGTPLMALELPSYSAGITSVALRTPGASGSQHRWRRPEASNFPA